MPVLYEVLIQKLASRSKELKNKTLNATQHLGLAPGGKEKKKKTLVEKCLCLNKDSSYDSHALTA